MTDEWPDWMLNYSAKRKLAVAGEQEIDQHAEAIVRDEETEHQTAWTAARAAIFEQLSDYGGR